MIDVDQVRARAFVAAQEPDDPKWTEDGLRRVLGALARDVKDLLAEREVMERELDYWIKLVKKLRPNRPWDHEGFRARAAAEAGS